MTDDLAPPSEVLAFLVRTLSTRELWAWLSVREHEALRQRIALGFRATHEVLRQPVARARLASHLEKTPEDFRSLLQLWGESAPRVLAEVRALDDAALIAQLTALQRKFGAESLLLALLHEDRTEPLEAWTAGEEAARAGGAEGEAVGSPSSPSSREVEALKRQRARESSRAEHWRAKFKDLQARAAANEKTLRDKLAAQEKLAREAARQGKAESIRATSLETKLLESEKARERAERRARSTQAENESVQLELKTLRRQLHRLQQINEELRGRLALVPKKREGGTEERRPEDARESGVEKPVNNGSTSPVPASVVPQPRKFTKPDGLKIREAVDRNDEAFIATLRDELSTLRARDAAAYKRLLRELSAHHKYYARVLTNPTARVLVDASNVARYDATKKGRLQYLLAMREELRRHDFFPILFVADASLPYYIDEPQKLRAMIAAGQVLITASGQEADEVLARQARETGAYVVTNDRSFHFAFAPDFAPSRLGFRIEDGVVLLNDER